MIEVQLKNEEQFNKVAPYAVYASPITRVVCIEERYRSKLPNDVSYDQVNMNPILDYSNKDFITLNTDDTTRYYLGAYKNFQDHFNLRTLPLISNLIQQDMFHYSDKFLETFSNLNPTSTINDLECSKYKYRVNGKLQSFDNVKHLRLDRIFSDVEQQGFILNIEEVNIISSIKDKDRHQNDRWSILAQYTNKSGEVVDIDFDIYSKSELLNNILTPGGRVELLLNQGSFYEIAPKGIEPFPEMKVSPSKNIKKELNKLPVMLFRMAYAEYIIRKHINS